MVLVFRGSYFEWLGVRAMGHLHFSDESELAM